MKKTLKLRKPIMIDGNETKEINLDFENLSLKDMIEAEKMMLASGQISMTIEEMNYSWHAYLFAAAAKKEHSGSEITDFLRIKGTDALRAREMARNFILSAEDGEEEISEPQQ